MGTWKLSGWALVGLVCLSPAREAYASRAAYEVQAGDSLWQLARQSGCSIERLREANGLSGDLIRVGRHLTIPHCPTRDAASSRYTVRPGDTLSHIAARFGTSVHVLERANALTDASHIVIGQSLTVPSPRAGASHTSNSNGSPWRGSLNGGVQLPQDPSYYRRRIANAYGTPSTISHLHETLRRVKDRHPGVHRVAIGDISRAGGGPLSGHRSHQSGRDVDLGLYFESRPREYPHRFVAAHEAKLALAPLWTLIELLARDAGRPGGPQYVFLDYEIQKQLHRYARKRGVSKAKLNEIFQYPDGLGVKDRLVRHEAKHDDHLHIRYHCAEEDAQCQS